MRRRFVGCLALILAFAVGACDDRDPTGVNAEVTGTWSLETVNGQPLPFVIFSAGTSSIAISAMTLQVNSSGTFSQTTTERLVLEGETSTDVTTTTGTWTRSGSALTFNIPATDEDPADQLSATFSGSTITIVDAGITGVFKRQ